jgi:zinc transport system substrate-binding protein
MEFIETKYQLAIFLLIPVALIGCIHSSQERSNEESHNFTVVTTIYPLQYFAERIGGDRVQVIGLVKPGVDAHAAELTTQDMHVLSNANVVISNGLGMEPWLGRALKALGDDVQARILETASEEVAVGYKKEGNHTGLDPHFWLDPIRAATQAQLIAQAFIASDKSNKSYYLTNLSSLTADLQELDKNFESAFSDCRHKEFVISHASFGYIALRYDLKQLEIAGISHETSPSARRLGNLSDIINKHELKAILVEPLHRDGSFSKTLAKEVGIQVLDAHVLASVSPAELNKHGDYFGLMRDNIRSLRVAMECNE